MPYPNETSAGESLLWLENSPVLQEYQKTIVRMEDLEMPAPIPVQVARQKWEPRRVIAIDGSHVTKPLNRGHRGFPVTEVGIVMISVVFINLNLLRSVPTREIPRPKIFHDMEKVKPYAVGPVPGSFALHKDEPNELPVNLFRKKVHQIFATPIEGHETLLDTLRDITQGHSARGDCPAGCGKKFNLGEKACKNCGEVWYETDVLRLHEYFDDAQSAQQAHSELRSSMEVLVLLNLLRFFVNKCPQYLADCLFVLDGPLATFGAPASILRPVRDELLRINQKAQEVNRKDIALIGVEKSGILGQHWEQVDSDEDKGPRSVYDNSAVITPSSDYIRKNIKFSKKDYGYDTHFGRFVMYKTNKGEHVVLHTAMLSEHSRNFANNDLSCFHRLGDALDVVDELSTYLYRDGFMPLVRAHANAAIPLKRGTDIIGLFEDK